MIPASLLRSPIPRWQCRSVRLLPVRKKSRYGDGKNPPQTQYSKHLAALDGSGSPEGCADRNQYKVPVSHKTGRGSDAATACCLLLLPQRGPGGRLRTPPSQTHLRLREWVPCPKEYCGTSCGGRRWRESSRCPARLLHLPASGRRIRLSSASRSGFQCSAICQFRRKCDGQLG